jgi:arginine repressor
MQKYKFFKVILLQKGIFNIKTIKKILEKEGIQVTEREISRRINRLIRLNILCEKQFEDGLFYVNQNIFKNNLKF